MKNIRNNEMGFPRIQTKDLFFKPGSNTMSACIVVLYGQYGLKNMRTFEGGFYLFLVIYTYTYTRSES